MPTVTIRLPEPHPAQRQIQAEAKRFNVVALGRRAGKTTMGLELACRTALRGRPVGWFAPTYHYLEEAWRDLKAALEPVIVEKREVEHRLRLINGGVIEGWSMDTVNPGRGRKYALAIIDEAAMVPTLGQIWRQAVRPTLADLLGSAWFLSTPKGLNDFFNLWSQGQDPLRPDWASWQMPTAVNPYIDPQEIASAEADSTEQDFAQEWLAKFLNIDGIAVFRGVLAVTRLAPQPPIRGHRYVAGVDWGRSNDYTVISLIDLDTRAQVLIDRFSELDYDFQVARLHRLASAYRPIEIRAEANSMGLPLIERLQHGWKTIDDRLYPALNVVPWTATNATKAAVVQALSLAIEDGAITLLDDQVQRGELLAFESKVTQTGLVRYSAPEGLHDDTVIALALAQQSAQLIDVSRPRRSQYGFSRVA